MEIYYFSNKNINKLKIKTKIFCYLYEGPAGIKFCHIFTKNVPKIKIIIHFNVLILGATIYTVFTTPRIHVSIYKPPLLRAKVSKNNLNSYKNHFHGYIYSADPSKPD